MYVVKCYTTLCSLLIGLFLILLGNAKADIFDEYQKDGVIQNTTVARNNLETRQTFIALLVRALEKRAGLVIEVEPNAKSYFDDVENAPEPEKVLKSDILKAEKLGIITLNSNKLFNPFNNITRLEALAFIVRAYEQLRTQIQITDGIEIPFVDLPLKVEDWSDIIIKKGYIERLAMGYPTTSAICKNSLKNYPNRNRCFLPVNKVDRYEALSFIENLVKKIGPILIMPSNSSSGIDPKLLRFLWNYNAPLGLVDHVNFGLTKISEKSEEKCSNVNVYKPVSSQDIYYGFYPTNTTNTTNDAIELCEGFKLSDLEAGQLYKWDLSVYYNGTNYYNKNKKHEEKMSAYFRVKSNNDLTEIPIYVEMDKLESVTFPSSSEELQLLHTIFSDLNSKINLNPFLDESSIFDFKKTEPYYEAEIHSIAFGNTEKAGHFNQRILDNSWHLYVLFITTFSNSSVGNGVMFDSNGRIGVVVGVDTLKKFIVDKKWNDPNKYILRTTAHELGHTLGLEHDNKGKEMPDYIMHATGDLSEIWNKNKTYNWSPCSKEYTARAPELWRPGNGIQIGYTYKLGNGVENYDSFECTK